ncbi:MAG: GntR family transcriptional regulator [Chloroflexota bacterium]|nr:GntR family transcriptional regulator [Chloroflexota bacterium]MDE2947682.1 GntR family transcriptional regulator [Chloroflexota bacterium]
MPEKLDKIRLDHNSYISLHVQLHNQLRRLIVSGRWRYGERIPTEMQLARHLDISRTTVRIATQRLEVEGLIKRSAGRGTFVMYQPRENSANRSIGYLTCSFHNEIHTNILSSAQTELRSAGYQVIFSNSRDRDDEARILRQLLDDEVAGLMLWANAKPTDETLSILAEFAEQEIPIVFMDRLIDGIHADYVASDNFGGSYDLVCHLVELGHRHIVQLMPNIDDLHPVNERRRGYMTALEERGLFAYAPWKISAPGRHEFHETDIYSLVGSGSRDVIQQVESLTDAEGPMPTAIVCVNDILAIVTISALRNMGYGVPDDVSVVGFDDISLASHIGVPLTTATQDAYELGKVASQMLLERLSGEDLAPRSYAVPTKLSIRASTAAPFIGVDSLVES